jgi:hypothetical protein
MTTCIVVFCFVARNSTMKKRMTTQDFLSSLFFQRNFVVKRTMMQDLLHCCRFFVAMQLTMQLIVVASTKC